jgi:collagen type III alpha
MLNFYNGPSGVGRATGIGGGTGGPDPGPYRAGTPGNPADMQRDEIAKALMNVQNPQPHTFVPPNVLGTPSTPSPAGAPGAPGGPGGPGGFTPAPGGAVPGTPSMPGAAGAYGASPMGGGAPGQAAAYANSPMGAMPFNQNMVANPAAPFMGQGPSPFGGPPFTGISLPSYGQSFDPNAGKQ